MSFLEGAESELSVGNRAGYMAQMIDAGMSGNAILNALSDAGIGIQRATGLRMIGEIRAGADRSADVVAMASDVLPDDSVLSTWSTARADGYAYQVQLFVKDDQGEVFTLQHTVVTDSLIDKATAIDAALSDQEDSTSKYGYSAVGGLVSNIYVMTPGGG